MPAGDPHEPDMWAQTWDQRLAPSFRRATFALRGGRFNMVVVGKHSACLLIVV